MRIETHCGGHGPVLFPFLVLLALVGGPTLPTMGDTIETEWRLEKREDGIEVHTRPVPGSGIRAFKGEAVIAADLESILNVLRDAEHYQDWFPNCPESRLLRREESVVYQYNVTAAPWPVDDRDNIFRSVLERDAEAGAAEISIRAAPDFYPEQPGRVRVQSAEGRWRLEPRGEDSTWVLFELHLEPGGGIPDWMANARIISTPFEALTNLRRMTGRSGS